MLDTRKRSYKKFTCKKCGGTVYPEWDYPDLTITYKCTFGCGAEHTEDGELITYHEDINMKKGARHSYRITKERYG